MINNSSFGFSPFKLNPKLEFVIISDGKVTIYLRQKQHFLTSSIHLPNKMTPLTDFQYAPFNGAESDEVRILRCFFVCELYSPR